jgi:hypothetical protein
LLCGLLPTPVPISATADQAQAAWIYGEIIGHNGLRAWTCGMQALIEYWYIPEGAGPVKPCRLGGVVTVLLDFPGSCE